jgi:hypothetical protein
MRTPAILVLTFALALPTMAQPGHIQAPGAPATGPYTHEATGITFPAAIGQFRRTQISGDPKLDAIGAHYALMSATGRLTVTVFVLRLPQGQSNPMGIDICAAMAQAGRQAALQLAPQARIVPLEPPPVATGWIGTAFSAQTEGTAVQGTPSVIQAHEQYFYCAAARDRGVFIDFLHPPAFDARGLEKSFIEGLALPAR